MEIPELKGKGNQLPREIKFVWPVKPLPEVKKGLNGQKVGNPIKPSVPKSRKKVSNKFLIQAIWGRIIK